MRGVLCECSHFKCIKGTLLRFHQELSLLSTYPYAPLDMSLMTSKSASQGLRRTQEEPDFSDTELEGGGGVTLGLNDSPVEGTIIEWKGVEGAEASILDGVGGLDRIMSNCSPLAVRLRAFRLSPWGQKKNIRASSLLVPHTTESRSVPWCVRKNEYH